MARPQLVTIESGAEAWDADVNDNTAILRDAPTPLFELPSADDETDLATDFPANTYDRCVAMVNHSTLGWTLMYSDGTAWQVIPRRADAQADSTATLLADLVNDFNVLLGKLRDAGVIAP